MSPDLKQLLEHASDRVAPVDLTEVAWAGAQQRRRRQRFATVASAFAVAATVVGLVAIPRIVAPQDTLPAARPTGQWQPATFDLLGSTAQIGPTPAQVSRLPWVDDATRAQWGLPDVLGFDPQTPMAPLSSVAGSRAPVRAVLIKVTGDGLRPVLYRPDLPTPWVEVDGLDLTPVKDAGGNGADPLGSLAIADDRQRIVFAQPGKIVLLDAFSGQVRSIPVADPAITSAGWVTGNLGIVARSDAASWLFDTLSNTVTRLELSSFPGGHQITADPTGTSLNSFSPVAPLSQSDRRALPPVFASLHKDTINSAGGWAASGGFLSDAAQTKVSGGYQGVLAVDGQRTDSRARLLVAPSDSDQSPLSKGCCQALAWQTEGANSARALIQWGDDILQWDMVSGDLSRVSMAPMSLTLAPGQSTPTPVPSTDGPYVGAASGTFAIAP